MSDVDASPMKRRCSRLLVALGVVLLGGCSTLAQLPPEVQPGPPSTMLVAAAGAPLARAAQGALQRAESGVVRSPGPELSAVRGFPQGAFALDARVQLLRRAAHGIDLQTYHLAADGVGKLILRELRDAARRGVRVRLLLDDWYTDGMDPLLLGLAATPGVEVRLFNPFVAGRGSALGRLWGLATDFGRLNHRMHNKLLIVDGVLAVAGGRNLTDEYFLRGTEGNFIDFDVLLAGPVVAQLGAWFDRYWNTRDVIPVGTVAAPAAGTGELQRAFDDAVATTAAHTAPEGTDEYGAPSVGAELDAGTLRLLPARAGAHADVPDKRHDSERIRALTGAEARAEDPADSIGERFYALLAGARREVALSSPYFIPGQVGLAALRRLRERGVEVLVLTNATGSSDEPLVNVAYARYRNELLKMGVRLYELASTRLRQDSRLQRLFGDSVGRLHAKLALIDRELVLLGSMNLDPRSRHTNTELGLAVRSAELARRIRATYDAGAGLGVYEVVLAPDGRSIQWIGQRADGSVERLDSPPGLSWIEKLRLWLLAPLVSEELL